MQRSAFSLVELSIVLVILGLLTGGILAGQSLIRAAELRSVSAEHSRWLTATRAFRDKYFALPGDMANATSFWGTADGTACALTSTGDARTCNGNGNGILNPSNTGNAGNEFFRFWQHLANAGLVEGSFTGIRHYSSVDGAEANQQDNGTPGENVPGTKVGNGLWYASIFYGGTYYFTASFSNVLLLGVPYGSTFNGPPRAGLLKPEEAWNLDTKMDDGKPGIGKVMSSYDTNCVSGAASNSDNANGVYNLSYTSNACMLVFGDPF